MKKILIAGPSGSGKSTVAQKLAIELDYIYFSLDNYFIKPSVVEFENEIYPSYENPMSYDGNLLADHINAFEGHWFKGLVIEGFCLFAYPRIFSLESSRFFLDASYEFCLTRRLKRSGGERLSDASYKIVGKSEAEKYVYPQKNMSDVTVIDATLDIDSILQQIKEKIK